jgi:hypothetical protein
MHVRYRGSPGQRLRCALPGSTKARLPPRNEAIDGRRPQVRHPIREHHRTPHNRNSNQRGQPRDGYQHREPDTPLHPSPTSHHIDCNDAYRPDCILHPRAGSCTHAKAVRSGGRPAPLCHGRAASCDGPRDHVPPSQRGSMPPANPPCWTVSAAALRPTSAENLASPPGPSSLQTALTTRWHTHHRLPEPLPSVPGRRATLVNGRGQAQRRCLGVHRRRGGLRWVLVPERMYAE